MIRYIVTLTDSHRQYILAHGNHFTDALADYASSHLRNANGDSHTWPTSKISQMIEAGELPKPKNMTAGDIAYTANMYYSDFAPKIMDEAACLKAAIKLDSDPDGYDGMVMQRWLADMHAKNEKLDWKKFI